MKARRLIFKVYVLAPDNHPAPSEEMREKIEVAARSVLNGPFHVEASTESDEAGLLQFERDDPF